MVLEPNGEKEAARLDAEPGDDLNLDSQEIRLSVDASKLMAQYYRKFVEIVRNHPNADMTGVEESLFGLIIEVFSRPLLVPESPHVIPGREYACGLRSPFLREPRIQQDAGR